jgi:GTP1/Obg family GTP-binding protein
MTIRNTLMLALFTFALAFAGSALAQDYQMEQQQQPTKDVTEQELEKFAKAQLQISEIQQDFAGRLQGIEDPEKAHELQVQANEEMTEAVEEVGLDVESFNEIAMAIQNDPELQQRLTAMLQDQR